MLFHRISKGYHIARKALDAEIASFPQHYYYYYIN